MSADAMVPSQDNPASLSLSFAPHSRPGADDVQRILQGHDLHPAEGRLDVSAGNWRLHLAGLAPATAVPTPLIAHRYGFAQGEAELPGELITLVQQKPLPPLAQRLPLARALVGLAAQLLELDGVQAVIWHPAGSAMAPQLFSSLTANWLQGGAFPALGLTALFADSMGAIRSSGLAFFTGQELSIAPVIGINTGDLAKIAVRLINQLVGKPAIHQELDMVGPSGERFTVEPSDNDRLLRIWRTSS